MTLEDKEQVMRWLSSTGEGKLHTSSEESWATSQYTPWTPHSLPLPLLPGHSRPVPIRTPPPPTHTQDKTAKSKARREEPLQRCRLTSALLRMSNHYGAEAYGLWLVSTLPRSGQWVLTPPWALSRHNTGETGEPVTVSSRYFRIHCSGFCDSVLLI